MNSYERCMAAMHFQQVDRIPTDLHNFMMCAKESGEPFSEFVLDAEGMAKAQMRLLREFGQDMLLIENGTAALAEAMGCGGIYREKDCPVAHGAAIDSLKDVRKLKPDERILESPLVRANLETVRILKRELGDSVFLMGRGDQGPFSLAAQIYGMNRLLEDLLDEECEEEIFELLQACVEAEKIYCRALLEAGAHGTSLGDSTAGPDVLSPALYEKFAMPFERQVARYVHGLGGTLALHICGNATRIIDRMMLAEADILEIDQKTDLAEVFPGMKGRQVILGQISPLTLFQGTEEQVREETGRMLGIVGGKRQTGVILGPGCAMGTETPYGNVKAMLGIVR
ncbi:MAG: uroporphyrinogen decarboxylase family protein [Eubacteriales bacterium]|nr:uroporphyrinogen decarboxylase family protein [Eubacteriales bacterium]